MPHLRLSLSYVVGNNDPCYHHDMPRKPNPPRDDPEQSERFIKIAREAEAESTKDEFERAFRKVVTSKARPEPSPRRKNHAAS
jgi:hypothetical protein